MKYQAIDSEYIREMKERDEFLRQKGYMLKGVKYGYFVAIIIIILSAFFSGNLVLATPNDIDYTFQNDNLYETTTPVYDDSFNVKNSSVYTGVYNATYSFTGETGLTDTAISFVDVIGSGFQTIINESLDGHNEVIRNYRTGSSAHAPYNIIDVIQGEIEYWTYTTGDASFFQLTDDVDLAVNILYYDTIDTIRISHAGTSTDFTVYEGWVHIKVEFNCTSDTQSVWLNGILAIDDLAFYQSNDLNSILNVKLGCSSGVVGYYDGIGYSWDGYTEGDNLIPYLEISDTIKEVDRWEFSYSDFPTQYAIDSDIFSDWTEDDTGDHINIAMDYNSLDGMPLYFPDRTIKIHDHIVSADEIGIERDFDVLDGIINVSWSLNFTDLDALSESEVTTEIYSSDDTLLYQIYLEHHDICYKDGGEVQLENGIITTGEIYEFNLYHNPYDNIGILRFYIDGVFYDSYYVPSLDSSKKGLGKIKFKNYYDPNRELIVYLDYIGVYSNGTSLSTEPAFRQVDLDDGLFHVNWDFVESNLLTLNLEGNIGIHLTDWYFYIGSTTIEEVLSAREFNGTDIIYNVYDQTYNSQDYIYSPRFWFEFYDQIEFTDDYLISMDGVVLDDGTTNYHLEFTSQNVETHNSYFYVSGDSLYYKMVANDNGLEYIQASFDIINLFAGNRSLAYRGQKSGTSVINAQFIAYYTDTSYNYFNLEANYKSIAVLLPNDKTIDTFDLLISDDGSDLSDSITGYLGSFTLLYVPLITTDFISISFFDALPIVVLVVVIPIALYIGFGKKKELLIPSIMAMSIFGTAVGLIPLWLTFVIGFGCVSALIINSRS